LITVLALALPASASANVSSVLSGQTISGNAIPCTTQSDGVRVCHGTDGGGGASDLRMKTFDGVPLEVYVILPPAPSSGTDGNYPLIAQSHGWGGAAAGPTTNGYDGPTGDALAKDGYAVVQLTARGWGDSCGSSSSRLAAPTACANGYIRLDDERYEVRDIQTAAGYLVDDGLVNPNKIGATGPSYGGGVSLELATLKNRIMNSDGSFSPWKSPKGTPLHLAAAVPIIPWSDLDYSLMPNGRTLDYQVTPPTADLSPIGVEKQSFVSGLYLLGNVSGYYAPPMTNSQADLTTWYGTINGGEPYDGQTEAEFISKTIAQFHSAYYLLNGAYGAAKESPSPMLVANGFTDDLFPVDEGVRYYNLERSLHPSNPIALFDWDGGHQRGQNKPADNALLASRVEGFFDHYVKHTASTPRLGATALTQTCPSTAPSGGPFYATTWAGLHPGEVLYNGKGTQTISSSAGDTSISAKIDPITGGGACATVSSADQGSGVATYRLPAAKDSGYTLLGSPTVIANLKVTGTYGEIAERLWDVDPKTKTETLVARGVYRIDPNKPNGYQVFQLHPGAWHFAAGHIPKLELLGRDAPYVRASNGTFTISVSNLQLRLPVHERPGSSPPVTKPKRPVKPGQKPPATICKAHPRMKVSHAGVSKSGMSASGTASPGSCSGVKAAKVTRVSISIYRKAAHGKCRYLNSGGQLTKARPCSKAIWFIAKGTATWKFSHSHRKSLPKGLYWFHFIAADAAKRHSHQANRHVRLH
jgi:dienelactone hydrolase